MRSSDSANNPSRTMSVMIRKREGNRNAQASARIQNAISLQCQRASRAALCPTSAGAFMANSTGRGAAEQAVRTPDQDHNHNGVDHERADLWHIVFLIGR